MSPYLAPLAGGALIGASAAMLLLLNGRIAGISGIAAGLLGAPTFETLWRAAFVFGLVLGPVAYLGLYGHWPDFALDAPWPVLIVGGLFVGFGTRLGSGCTSGHGVCGLARLSRRSLAAVATFMSTAIITLFVVRHG